MKATKLRNYALFGGRPHPNPSPEREGLKTGFKALLFQERGWGEVTPPNCT